MSMSSETTHEIPEQIREIMQDGEIGNMRNLCGWAVGRVSRQDTAVNPDGPDVEVLDEAWIELFNGKGRAGESAEQSAGSTVEDRRSSKSGGVRFMAVDDAGGAVAWRSTQATGRGQQATQLVAPSVLCS